MPANVATSTREAGAVPTARDAVWNSVAVGDSSWKVLKRGPDIILSMEDRLFGLFPFACFSKLSYVPTFVESFLIVNKGHKSPDFMTKKTYRMLKPIHRQTLLENLIILLANAIPNEPPAKPRSDSKAPILTPALTHTIPLTSWDAASYCSEFRRAKIKTRR